MISGSFTGAIMAIVRCSCGWRTSVSDALAGKNIRCGGCGQPVLVVASARPAGAKPKEPLSARFYISKGKIYGSIFVAIALTVILTFCFGPVRVWHQWEAMEPHAEDDVKN